MNDDDSDNLAQYLPTWQTDGRGLGATPPADTPPLAPAYGQVGAEQADPAAAAATGAPPVGAPSPPPSSSPSTITMRAVVVSGGIPAASTVTVVT